MNRFLGFVVVSIVAIMAGIALAKAQTGVSNGYVSPYVYPNGIYGNIRNPYSSGTYNDTYGSSGNIYGSAGYGNTYGEIFPSSNSNPGNGQGNENMNTGNGSEGNNGSGNGGSGGATVQTIKVYGANFTIPIFFNATDWTEIPLAVTLRPSSPNSNFLVNVNVVAVNGDAPGVCQIGLFRNGNALVAPFATRDVSNWDASPSGITYVDGFSQQTLTFSIKVKGRCYINRSQGNTAYTGASSISVLEISGNQN